MKQERLTTKDVAETSASDERTSDVYGRCAEVLARARVEPAYGSPPSERPV